MSFVLCCVLTEAFPRLVALMRGGVQKQSRICLFSDSLPIGLISRLKEWMSHFTASFIIRPFTLFRRVSTMQSSRHMETFTIRLECVVGHTT